MNPLLGRWVSADPLAVHAPGEADLNGYAYVSGHVLKSTDPFGLKEFESHDAYTKSQTDAGLEVKSHEAMWSQGHWLESDRSDNTAVWKAANSHNLQTLGHGEYQTIEQRADFYEWFQGASAAKGHETKWAGAASEVAKGVDQMNHWAHTLSDDPDTIAEVRDFAKAGNKAIFNDVFGKLRKLFNGAALKGDAARKWDQETLAQEQRMVQTGYESVSKDALSVIETSAKQSSFWTKLGSAYAKITGKVGLKKSFEGNIMKAEDRWRYGISEMGRDPKKSMPDVPSEYRDGSRYKEVLTW